MRPADASTDIGTGSAAAGGGPGAGAGSGAGDEFGDRASAAADASLADANAGTHRAPDPGKGPDDEDTLDLRLPDEITVLFAEERRSDPPPKSPTSDGRRVTAERTQLQRYTAYRYGIRTHVEPAAQHGLAVTDGDLLDHVAEWGPTHTPFGAFRLVPVRIERDLSLINRWMNDPAVAAFWELGGPPSEAEAHLRAQLDGDGRSVPCLGVIDGRAMSYWEVYRADLDPLARHYPARPYDTGLHLLIGRVADRGRGMGTALLRAVADLVLDHRPRCARVIAEPDLRNTPSVSAFLSAGFRFSAEVDLPGKRAALMVRDRALRSLL